MLRFLYIESADAFPFTPTDEDWREYSDYLDTTQEDDDDYLIIEEDDDLPW